MSEAINEGMVIFRARHIESGEEKEFECLDEMCARLLAVGDGDGDVDDWEIVD